MCTNGGERNDDRLMKNANAFNDELNSDGKRRNRSNIIHNANDDTDKNMDTAISPIGKLRTNGEDAACNVSALLISLCSSVIADCRTVRTLERLSSQTQHGQSMPDTKGGRLTLLSREAV